MTKIQHAIYLVLFSLVLSAHIATGFRLRNLETQVAVLQTRIDYGVIKKQSVNPNEDRLAALEDRAKDDEYTFFVYQDFVNSHLDLLWPYATDTQNQVNDHEERLRKLEGK